MQSKKEQAIMSRFMVNSFQEILLIYKLIQIKTGRHFFLFLDLGNLIIFDQFGQKPLEIFVEKARKIDKGRHWFPFISSI
jgi:hypothetical protein